MPTTKEAWSDQTLGRTATLVLGWRSGRNIVAQRLPMSNEIASELRTRAAATLAEIRERRSRSFQASAELEPDEVFLLTADELPFRKPLGRRGRPRPQEIGPDAVETAEPSTLLACLRKPGELLPMAPDDARGRSFLFYAVVFTQPHLPEIAFVKHHNPGAVLKSGRVFGLFASTLTKIDEPILIFDPNFDLVASGDDLVALTPHAIVRLFADVEVATSAVPDYVQALQGLPIGLPTATLTAIQEACGHRRLLARRLADLLDQPHISTLTVAQVQTYLRALKIPTRRFIHNGQLVVTADDVDALLDLLDQRNYLGAYDEILRRADRTSIVSP